MKPPFRIFFPSWPLLVAWLLAAIVAWVIPGPLKSAELEVDLELALAIDVSGSVDEEEAALQRTGYIAAFRHPSVVDAIRHGPLGQIAVTYYEWAGFGHMKVIAPWSIVHDKASADAFAGRLEQIPPQTARRTAIADAIDFGAASFDDNGFAGRRRVIDISGDGPNNWGGVVALARDRAVASGVTINGLPIVNNRPSFFGLPPMPDLDLYYRDCVIGGPGAFYVAAKDFKDFARAVLRKLILEIADRRPETGGPARHAAVPLRHFIANNGGPGSGTAEDCEARGRRNWQRFQWNDEN